MGLEAAIRIDDPGACPVSDAAEQAGTPIKSVSRTSVGDDVVEEFETDSTERAPDGTEKVFGDDRYAVYWFERDRPTLCFCERIETFGSPVVDIRSDAGELRVVFRPSDVETTRFDSRSVTPTTVRRLRP